MLKLYHELAAGWYRILTPVTEYKEESGFYHSIFKDRCKLSPQTILELGSGAGHNAFYLKQWYRLTLSDISAPMLAISKDLNPACEHIQGDMRTMRLGKTYDAIFIHDAVMYMTTEEDLERAMVTAFNHCNPGGMVLITPDFIKENFHDITDHGGSDYEDRGLRYLEWTKDPDSTDCTYTVDYAYMMKEADGKIQVVHDHHVEGLFSESTWLQLLQKAGFDGYPIAEPGTDKIYFIGYKNY
jgi:trans-aconitate methyltransferase